MQVLTFSCLKKHSIFSSRNTLLQETRFWKTLGIFFRATRFPSLGSVTDLREEYKSYLVRIIFVNSNHRFTFHFNDRLYKQPSGLMIESKAAWSKRTNILTSEVKHHGSMGSIIYCVPLKPFHEGMAWGFFFFNFLWVEEESCSPGIKKWSGLNTFRLMSQTRFKSRDIETEALWGAQ